MLARHFGREAGHAIAGESPAIERQVRGTRYAREDAKGLPLTEVLCGCGYGRKNKYHLQTLSLVLTAASETIHTVPRAISGSIPV